MTAYLPTGGIGDANWQDLIDNWTEADAEFLQGRVVARITNASDTTLASLVATPGTGVDNKLFSIAAGRVFYNTTTKSHVVSTDGTDAGLKVLLSSKVIRAVDGGSSTELKGLSAAAGSGLTLTHAGGVSATNLTISGVLTVSGSIAATGYASIKAGTSGALTTSSSGVTVNTDNANPVVITSEATSRIRITGSLIVTSALTISGASTLASLTVSGSTTLAGVTAGAVTANSLAVTTTSTFTGTITAAAITASGTVTTTNLTSSGPVSGTNISASGTITSTGTLIASGNATVAGTLGVTGIATFTAIPVGPASDPTTANQLSRKSYVDAGDLARVKLFDYQNILIGSAPTLATTQFLRQEGTQAGNLLTVGGPAFQTITFPTPFPNGVLNIGFCMGDSANLPTSVPFINNSQTTKNGFTVTFPGAAAGFPTRFNWWATGW